MGALFLRISEIVKIDSKGRITIPLIMRESLGLMEGMYVVLIADTERREIMLTPILPPQAKIVEIKLLLKDEPGALAKVAGELANQGIDMITNRCASIKRGETAECIIIVDVSNMKLKTINDLKITLYKIPVVKYLEIRNLMKSVQI